MTSQRVHSARSSLSIFWLLSTMHYCEKMSTPMFQLEIEERRYHVHVHAQAFLNELELDSIERNGNVRLIGTRLSVVSVVVDCGKQSFERRVNDFQNEKNSINLLLYQVSKTWIVVY